MDRLHVTRYALEQAKKFKKYKEDQVFNSSKESDLFDDISWYLIHYILFVFSRETKNKLKNIKEHHIEKNNIIKNNENKEHLKQKINSILNKKDELPAKYNSFIHERNKSAHDTQEVRFTWENLTDITLHDYPDECFHIAEIGEKMLKLINDELDKTP